MWMNCDVLPQAIDSNVIEQASGFFEDLTYLGIDMGTDVPGVTLTALIPVLIMDRC
jgi:hypothetical protein